MQRGRNLNGILLLDKPAGRTSNQVLQVIKRLFDANKAGHTGNLDRPATGLLIICFGRATKISGFLLNADKYYRVGCSLGIQTTTGDAEGDIVEQRPVDNYSATDIRPILSAFTGESKQVPPMYSALKHNGRRLYRLAYQGISVARTPRKITISKIKLLDYASERLSLEVHCSKGTYIRVLVEDIGDKLGCGAHVHDLRRLGIGHFSAQQMLSLDTIEDLAQQGYAALDKLLLPIDAALTNLATVYLDEKTAYYLRRGRAVRVSDAPAQGWLRIYDERGNFFAIGEARGDGHIATKRLIIP